MKFVADLHLHSKYSRAVSQDMTLPQMEYFAKIKGISVLATGDFTHPFWFERLKTELEQARNGLYKLKTTDHRPRTTEVDSRQSPQDKQDVYFLLSCEISSIYTQGEKVRRIHNLFFFPTLASVEKFNKELLKRGANLRADGRPIVGITSRDLVKIALSTSEKALIIPAHAWTPWFSIFGSFSGFDSVEECFGDMASYIYGVETGLSSDPAMNWQIVDLDQRAILSFSDAHSPMKMGREATVFEASSISYQSIFDAIKVPKVTKEPKELKEESKSGSSGSSVTSVTPKIVFTIEFYPEEGKYHFSGHRDCNVSLSPAETAKKGDICPVCNRKLTIGVMHRVEELKTKSASRRTKGTTSIVNGVRWIENGDSQRPPFVSLVPLSEILAEALGMGIATKGVMDQYFALIKNLGNEFNVLLKAELNEIAKFSPQRVVDGIDKVRRGDIQVEPGYDGKYGIVKIWPETPSSGQLEDKKSQEQQLNLFA